MVFVAFAAMHTAAFPAMHTATFPAMHTAAFPAMHTAAFPAMRAVLRRKSKDWLVRYRVYNVSVRVDRHVYSWTNRM